MPFDSTDINLARNWRNDYRIWKWCRQNDLISDQDQANWFNRQSSDPTIRMYKLAMICENEEKQKVMQMIGVCGLTSIDMTNRRAEFSLYVGPEYWGNGFGEYGLSCLLHHGFENLGLYQIWGEVFDGNPAMKIFEKLGFKLDGTRRNFYYRNGEFINTHLISLLREEWKTLSTLA